MADGELTLARTARGYWSRSGATDEPKWQRLQARGVALRASTADLIVRSRRAIDRSRGLLGSSYRIVRQGPRR